MDQQVEKTDITRPEKVRRARGRPGKQPTWSSGAKTLVGTAASSRSRVWFTIGLGTLNEIYFADVEQANTRSVRFLISDGDRFFSDEGWHAEHVVTTEAGVPCCRIESRCKLGRYTLEKEIVADPVHDAVLIRTRFTPAEGANLKLYLFVDPHIGDKGENNDAWTGQYKGRPMLLAKRESVALAAAFSVPVKNSNCGYVGRSDGYTLLSKHRALPGANLAEGGNVCMTAELDYRASEDGWFVVSIGFGTSPAEAAQEATTGVLQKFDQVHAQYVQCWQEAQGKYLAIEDLSGHRLDMYRVSTAVLETHQSKRFPGGFIASLSLPWGFVQADKDIGGYHVLWPRDMVETAMGKLASGDARAARSTLFFLRCTQEASGGWSQNMFLDGTPHWNAVQMDGSALPILLADRLRRDNALDGYDALPMIHAAARYLLQHGPCTEQDRWEELPGYSPYTTATEVAALLAAAEFIGANGDGRGATFLRETADAWMETIDELCYVAGTALAKAQGVEGYYVRISPLRRMETDRMGTLRNKLGNLRFGSKHQRAGEMVSPDALALVRFGILAPHDPRILNTIKVIDATLKRETATGPTWVRSSFDGYGEDSDGSPYKKTGQGRGWPLLAGERGHYELLAGNRDSALGLLATMSRQTSECGMIPEQVWDAPDLPDRMLRNGYPTGSGMPLVWAHSEYIKLLRSIHEGAVWDLPPQTVERYQVQKRTAAFQIWTPMQRRGWLAPGKDLRVDLPAAASVRWRASGGAGTVHTEDSGFGVHTATVPRSSTRGANRIVIHVEPDEPAGGKLKAQTAIIRCQVADKP